MKDAPRTRLAHGLLVYCGFWQAGHWLSNLYGLVFDRTYVRELLGPEMTDSQFNTLLLTGWIDLLLVSPLGVAAVALLFAKKPRWAWTLGCISAWMACYSAYGYTYLHMQFDTIPTGLTNLVLVWGTFLPIPVFAVWSTIRLAKNPAVD